MKIKPDMPTKAEQYINKVAKELAPIPPTVRRQVLEQGLEGEHIDRVLDKLGFAPEDYAEARLGIVEHALIRADWFDPTSKTGRLGR
jgi:hypothetical protein